MNFFKKYIMLILVFLWCFMIYSFSSQNGRESSTLSRGISKDMVVLLKKMDPNGKINLYKFNRKLRKTAHFLNYMVFSVILFYSFKGLSTNRALFFSLLVVLIVACADEYYQSFVPGREGRIKDVMIDFSGALLGMTIMYIKTKIYSKKIVS